MNLKHIALLFLTFLTLYACDNDSTTTSSIDVPKNDAQIYTFSMVAYHRKLSDSTARAQDSIRIKEVNKRNFAIDQLSSTIYNPDSMPYGTVIERALVSLGYNSNYPPQDIDFITPDSTYTWSTTDSIDFSKSPIEIQVTSNGGNIKKYILDLRIHQIDPEILTWTQVESLPVKPEKQKVIKVGSAFYSYTLQNNEISLYVGGNSSASGWEKSTVTGLPATVDFNSVVFFDNSFLTITTDGETYLSQNGIDWSKVDNNETLLTIYGELPASGTKAKSLLVALQDGGKYYYGVMDNAGNVELVSYIVSSPGDASIKRGFPLIGFSSLTNYGSSNAQSSLIIVAGADRNNTDLSTTWLVKRTNSGIEISSSAENDFFAGEGLSAFIYDSYLYILAKDKLYISDSWGNKWMEASSKQDFPSSFSSRTNQSVLVDDNNYIWIFGGLSTSSVSLDDIWKGRLNRLITD